MHNKRSFILTAKVNMKSVLQLNLLWMLRYKHACVNLKWLNEKIYNWER